MMRRLSSDRKGGTLVEFAFLAPVFVSLIVAGTQFATLFFAQSGLKHAVAEGARFAALFPRPTRARIIARIQDRRFGLDPDQVVAPTVTPGMADGRDFFDISMSYRVDMNFIIFTWPDITLTETRRVFVHPG